MTPQVAILQLMHTRGVGARTLSRLLKRLAHEQYPVHEFVAAPDSQLHEEYGFSHEAIAEIRLAREQAELMSEELASRDVSILFRGGAHYPDRLTNVLGDHAPPILFCLGNLGLLDMISVGFCGSRKASDKSLDMVSSCAASLASHSVNVISGYAYGIDQAAHSSVLQNGGVTTIVLATGILHFALKQSISQWVSESNCLVLSEFLPRLGWSVQNAMQRNRTICGLSDAVVIVESSLKGGTFEAGKAALELARPVFVVEYQQQAISPEGNEYFLNHGAHALRAKHDDSIDVNRLLHALQDAQSYLGQQSLFD